jgi:hypothetical protein
VCRDTVRLQVGPPNVLRAREEVQRHFSLSICYVGRRKLGEKTGICDEKRSFGVPGVRDVVARQIIGPRSGNSVSHPHVEKSAYQEICGNNGFTTGEERVFEDCFREESSLASASCERFLEHRSILFSGCTI